MQNIKIIGLGGIGTALCDVLCRYLNNRDIDYLVTLIDGDEYEHKNIIRQSFKELGNKATQKSVELKILFRDLAFTEIPDYLTSENIDSCISERDVVFLCVDNHKTRRLVSQYAQTLEDIIIISGGNEYTDGNVQLYVRMGGENITPTLTDYHPEILNSEDKSPEEMSCEELSASEPQLLFTNATAAIIMCWYFYNIETMKFDKKCPSEVYFDITTMNTLAKLREPKKGA